VTFINLLFLFGIRRNCLKDWKESIIVPIYKKGDKTDCILPTMYKILSNILLSSLTPYAEEIIGYHQC